MKKQKDLTIFSKVLLLWHQDIDRRLPWKETKDPYKIWLSEVILQQTSVAHGIQYYQRLIEAFPTVTHLAEASEDEVLSLWKGLGYYARARNLHHAAQQVVRDHKGSFPNTYLSLLSLKGVGVYTAAAIASFAYNLPHAVVDGNVYRVLSRYHNLSTPIDNHLGKKEYALLAQEHLDPNKSADYNQAIMDFGALQCTPVNPNCHACIMNIYCQAYQHGTVDLLPIKEKKLTVKSRYFNYLYITKGDKVWMNKRLDGDIWRGLYQLPLIESVRQVSHRKMRSMVLKAYDIKDEEVIKIKKVWYHEQRLTHRLIHGTFYQVTYDSILGSGQWVSIEDRDKIGVPKIIDMFFKKIQQ